METRDFEKLINGQLEIIEMLKVILASQKPNPKPQASLDSASNYLKKEREKISLIRDLFNQAKTQSEQDESTGQLSKFKSKQIEILQTILNQQEEFLQQQEQLEKNRYTFVEPTLNKKASHNIIRAKANELRLLLEGFIPNGSHETTQALINLEEFTFWANAAISRQL